MSVSRLVIAFVGFALVLSIVITAESSRSHAVSSSAIDRYVSLSNGDLTNWLEPSPKEGILRSFSRRSADSLNSPPVPVDTSIPCMEVGRFRDPASLRMIGTRRATRSISHRVHKPPMGRQLAASMARLAIFQIRASQEATVSPTKSAINMRAQQELCI
jgi:hypothetical protein